MIIFLDNAPAVYERLLWYGSKTNQGDYFRSYALLIDNVNNTSSENDAYVVTH